MFLMKLLSDTGLNTDPLGTPLVTDVHCDSEPLTTTLDAAVQLLSYPSNGPHIKSISLQFREKDVVVDSVKGFTEAQINDICCPSLSTDPKKKVIFFCGAIQSRDQNHLSCSTDCKRWISPKGTKAHEQTDEFLVTARELQTSDLPGAPLSLLDLTCFFDCKSDFDNFGNTISLFSRTFESIFTVTELKIQS
ncbi:hypothetical protein BTVI_105039 [Pitangus sulphuratus]|nr:hypothetical protein BTVI_105039 [Pitangus sulphuratus]